jgi:hypothetical protein
MVSSLMTSPFFVRFHCPGFEPAFHDARTFGRDSFPGYCRELQARKKEVNQGRVVKRAKQEKANMAADLCNASKEKQNQQNRDAGL